MPLTISRPAQIDVTRSNPAKVLYQFGDENTDGSFKITNEGIDFKFEIRVNGVWNLAGIIIAQASVLLGRQLKLSGAGEFLQTTGQPSGITTLIPRVEYTDLGTGQPHYPKLGELLIKQSVIPEPDSEVLVFGVLGLLALAGGTERRLVTAVWIEIGTTAPTTPIKFTISDSFGIGNIFYEERYEPELFTSNTKVRLPFKGGGFQTDPGQFLVFRFDTEPSTLFSVRRNSAFGFWFAFDFYLLSTEDLWIDTTTERILTSENGSVLVNEDGNVLLSTPT
jgi:hypothetical protein